MQDFKGEARISLKGISAGVYFIKERRCQVWTLDISKKSELSIVSSAFLISIPRYIENFLLNPLLYFLRNKASILLVRMIRKIRVIMKVASLVFW